MPDRVVRFSEQFFDRLCWLLPEEREADGTPSITDFILLDLPTVRDQLATDFENATVPTADPGVRLYVGSGVVVPRFAIFTVLEDDTVEAFWLAIEGNRVLPEEDSD